MSVDVSQEFAVTAARRHLGPKPVRSAVRVISTLVGVGLVFQGVSVPSHAQSTPAPITISASTSQPVQIQRSAEAPSSQAPPAESDYDGTLALTGGTFAIDRDYDQSAHVTVADNGSAPVTFYLECDNLHTDLSLNFVNAGSQSQPLVLQSGESQQIDMAIFAQNVENSTYLLPVYAHILDNGNDTVDSSTTVTLAVNQSDFHVGIELVSADPTTLAQTYTVTNNGAYISDLTLRLTGDARDYVQMDPGVSTYPMNTGDTVTVTLQPDLGKMVSDNTPSLSGSLVASSGQRTSSVGVAFQGDLQSFNHVPAGQLALYQSGNPYWNLDYDQQSVQEGPTTVDENGFSSSVSFNLTYGQDQIMPVSMDIAATPFTGDPATATVPPTLSTDAAGNTMITATQVVDQATYDSILAAYTNPTPEQLAAIEPATAIEQSAATASQGQQAQPLVTQTGAGMFVISQGLSVGGLLLNAFGHQGAGKLMVGLGALLSGYQVVDYAYGIPDWIQELQNPNLTTPQRDGYLASQILEGMLDAVGLFLSLAFIEMTATSTLWIGLGMAIAGLLLDAYQSHVATETARGDDPSLTVDFLSQQCINRREVDTSFQLLSQAPPSGVTVSSRMYPQKPVPIPSVSFSTSVNGQDTGMTQQAKLTDVLTTNLPADNFIPGADNTITRHFYVDGAHYITTADTEVNVEYPPDTPVWYSGSLDTAPNVQSLSDLAVYPEGINATDKVHLGTPNQLAIDVYNRGSRGAWADIVVSDDSGIIYTDSAASSGQYRYIPAFSSVQITVPWTPTTDQTTFTVDVTDKTVDGEERTADNNDATTVISTEPWAVPTVDNIAPQAVTPDTAPIFTADVSDTVDVVGARFLLDGEPVSSTVTSSVLSSGDVRYSVPSATLDEGTHSLGVDVDYKTASGKVETVSDSIDLNVAQPRKATFSVDSSIINPYVTVVTRTSSSGWTTTDSDLTQTAPNQYSLVETSGMMNNPDSYAIVVSGENGFTWATLGEDRETYSLKGQPTLTVRSGDALSLVDMTISPIDSGDMSTPPFFSPSVSVPPGAYDVDLLYSLGADNGVASAQADLTNGDSSIDLATAAELVSVELPDETGSGPIDARLMLGRSAQENYWASSLAPAPLSGRTDSGLIEARVSPGSSTQESILARSFTQEPPCAWSVSGPTAVTCALAGMGVDDKTNLDQASLLLNLGQALYQVDLLSNTPTSLQRSDLAAVSFAMSDGSPAQIDGLVLSNDDLGSYQMTGSTVFYPRSAFDVAVSYRLPGALGIHKASVDGQTNTTITLPTVSDGMAALSVEWPAGYSTQVSFPGNDLTTMAVGDQRGATLTRGEPLLLDPGDYDLEFYLYVDDNQAFTVDSHVSLAPGANPLVIGDHFTGTLTDPSGAAPGSANVGDTEGYVTLDNLVDQYGNTVKDLSSYADPMTGTVTFTNVNDPSDVVTLPVTTSYTILVFTWPNVDGLYTMNVVLSSGVSTPPSQSVSPSPSAVSSSPSPTPSVESPAQSETSPVPATETPAPSSTSPAPSPVSTAPTPTPPEQSPTSAVSSPALLAPSPASPAPSLESPVPSSVSSAPSSVLPAPSRVSPPASVIAGPTSSSTTMTPTPTAEPFLSPSSDPAATLLPASAAPPVTSQPSIIVAPTGGSLSSGTWLPFAGLVVFVGLVMFAAAVWAGSRPTVRIDRPTSKR
ncbi:MAG: hypothetical protein FWF43_03560 [Propionibacteriaceae bacterium]|nr:hypothetical protein [Propionibacteriaceae bacterium]